MITNPEYLSKDRLKQELKKRGVSFNPNENKDYYIQLFREKVMDKGRSELSSDDEFVRQSPRAVRKQQKVRARRYLVFRARWVGIILNNLTDLCNLELRGGT